MTSSRRVPWARLGAEAIVVVASILLALGVDEWRGAQQDRELEREYLVRLLDDLDANLQVIQVQHTSQAAQIRSARLVYPLVSRGDWTGLDSSTAVRASYLATPSPTPAWVTGTFEELQATGRMALIRSPRVRAGTLDYYRFLEAADYTYDLMSTEYRDAVRMRMDPDLQLRMRSECRPREATCPVDVGSPGLSAYLDWLSSNEALAGGLRRVIVQWTRGEEEFLPTVSGRTLDLKALVTAELAPE